MRILFWRAPKGEGMRHAANVIADAVQTAKDAAIAATEAELSDARRVHEQSRGAVQAAVATIRDFRRALADLPIEEGITTIGEDLGKRA